MNEKTNQQYTAIGLIFGAAIGTILGIFFSQLALFAAIGAGIGLTLGSISGLIHNK